MKLPDRTFVTESADVAATHFAKPLWFALFSPSGAGKTFSALRLATGMQSVLGGDIHLIDTENGRGLHYKDFFKYQYTKFEPPYGSLDYLVAINHAAAKGARVIIIDQLSYEHDGDGGMIDFHEAELERMAGDDWKKREAVKMLAWTKPKAARKQLIRAMLATNVAFVLCFRADETSKPAKNKETGKTEVLQMGFMPIAGRNFIYEATVSALLLPHSDGVPTWNPDNVGEKMMVKIPAQFKNLFKNGEQLSEAHGRELAEWARSGNTEKPAATKPAAKSSDSLTDRATAFKNALSQAKNVPSLKKTWNGEAGLTLRAKLDEAKAVETLTDLELTYDSQLQLLEEQAVAR